MTTSGLQTPALERVIQRGRASAQVQAEQCDLCSTQIPDEHRHLLDTSAGQVLCACQACTILFHRDAASEGHYRLVPQRRTRLDDVDPAALGVPVGLAFFVVGPNGDVIANYPSPAGPTQWQVDAQAWASVVAGCPALAHLAPQIEALLVDTLPTEDGGRRSEAWVVPIDDCFRLVAVVRQEWQGLSGGDVVRASIDTFFEQMRRADGADPRR